MSDDTKYIRELISEGEHQRQDFKFEITNARKIARTLVAFANTDGGRLLIGVKDNGRISGIRSDEEYYMIDAAASLYCRPEIRIDYFKRSAEGKTVLEIVVHPSEEKPHFAQDEDTRWLAYHRVKDNNFLADYILIQVWKREKRPFGTFIEYSDKEQAVLNLLRGKGAVEFSVIKNEIGMKKRALQNLLVNLISLKAVEVQFIESSMLFRIC